jgi:Domain of unknown function (DUF4190)
MYPYPQPAPREESGKAVAAMVLGILSVFFAWTFVAPLLALIFGIVSLRDIRRARDHGVNKTGEGMAVTGIVLGAVFLAGWALMLALIVLGSASGA